MSQRANGRNNKLFVHHGSYVRGRIAGRDELAGPDVIVVHRLLKGAAASAAGANGFALLTRHAVAALGIDPSALGLTPTRESIEHLGEVEAFVLDLEARWQAESGRPRLEVPSERAVLDLSVVARAEPAIVWAHLTSPSLRPLWEGPIMIEEIVDWQPYDHVGWRLAVPGVGPVEATVDLEATQAGTSVRLRWAARSGAPADTESIGEIVRDKRAALERLAQMLDREGHPNPAAVTA